MAVQEKFDLVIRAQDEATTTLRNVNREVERVAGSSMPRLTTATASYTREAIRADLKSAALGSRLAGLSPAVGQLSQAFMIGNPLVAAAAFGIGALSGEIVDAVTAHSRAEAAIRSHASSLIELANSSSLYAANAREVLEINAALIQKDKAVATGQLAMAEAGLRAATFLERLIGLGPLVAASADAQNRAIAEAAQRLADLKKEEDAIAKANLAEAFKATIGPMTSVDEITERLTNHSRALNEQWQQTMLLARGVSALGPLADTTAIGFSTDADQIALEQQRLNEAFAASGAGPMSWAVEHDMMVEQVKRQQDELAGYIQNSTERVLGGIMAVFTEGRINLGEIFKGMAADFIQFFVQQIARSVGAKIAGALLGAAVGSAIPGVGTVVGAGGGAAAGGAAGDFIIPTDILGKHTIPTNAVQASTNVIVVTAPLSLTQDFVRKHVMPEIKRLQMVGAA